MFSTPQVPSGYKCLCSNLSLIGSKSGVKQTPDAIHCTDVQIPQESSGAKQSLSAQQLNLCGTVGWPVGSVCGDQDDTKVQDIVKSCNPPLMDRGSDEIESTLFGQCYDR